MASTNATPYRWKSASSAEPFREWHRLWGRLLYATDIDFVEYTYTLTNDVKPVGLFEYKHVNGKRVDRDHAQLLIMASLADNSHLPAFFVRYTTDEPVSFKVYSLNPYASNIVGDVHTFSEYRFVCFLHYLHGLESPAEDRYTTDKTTILLEDNPPYLYDSTAFGPWSRTCTTTADRTTYDRSRRRKDRRAERHYESR